MLPSVWRRLGQVSGCRVGPAGMRSRCLSCGGCGCSPAAMRRRVRLRCVSQWSERPNIQTSVVCRLDCVLQGPLLLRHVPLLPRLLCLLRHPAPYVGCTVPWPVPSHTVPVDSKASVAVAAAHGRWEAPHYCCAIRVATNTQLAMQRTRQPAAAQGIWSTAGRAWAAPALPPTTPAAGRGRCCLMAAGATAMSCSLRAAPLRSAADDQGAC